MATIKKRMVNGVYVDGKYNDMSLDQKLLYFLSVDYDLFKYLKIYEYKIQPDDFVTCYYNRERNINVFAENRKMVSNAYQTDSQNFSVTICKIKHINVDLTDLNIKQIALENSIKHPMSLSTISQSLDTREEWKRQKAQERIALSLTT
jgi:hypothetical protein